MVAYDNMIQSSLSLSLTLSISNSGSTGHQLKASVALLVLCNLYRILKLNRASMQSQQICDTPNLLVCMYARGLLSVYRVNFDPTK